MRGRRKAIWISVSADLVEDSKRDLRDIGARRIQVYNLSKVNLIDFFFLSEQNISFDHSFLRTKKNHLKKLFLSSKSPFVYLHFRN